MTKKVERSDTTIHEEPKLPHERDQQPASQSLPDDPVTEESKQAHKDLKRGLVDTDRGPPMDRIYRKAKE